MLMIALSTSAPVFFPFELQARVPLDDLGVFPLEDSLVVSLLTRLLSLTFSNSGLSVRMESSVVHKVTLSSDSSETSAPKSSSLSLLGDEEFSTVQAGDFDLRFVLDGLCAICGLSHSRF